METVTVAKELTPKMIANLRGFLDEVIETPYIYRYNKIHENDWEVVQLLNEDWRDVIGNDDEQVVLARYSTRKEAKEHLSCLVVRWIYEHILSIVRVDNHG